MWKGWEWWEVKEMKAGKRRKVEVAAVGVFRKNSSSWPPQLFNSGARTSYRSPDSQIHTSGE